MAGVVTMALPCANASSSRRPKHLHRVAACAIAALTASVPAHADFLGLEVENITENSIGLVEFAIYAVFSEPNDVLLGVGNANIACTTGFFHNTINGTGALALPFTSAQNAVSDHPDADSFVTIDYSTGDSNNTIISPTFDVDAFINGNNLGADAGWSLAAPPPLGGQGTAGADGRVLLAVFTPLNQPGVKPGIVSGTLTVAWDDPDLFPTQFSNASFVTPAPGALGLLALAGVAGRSRRRRTGSGDDSSSDW